MDGLAYQVRHVSKSYNGRKVLAVDQLEIHRGEILALVGPSGAGKSTLLRLLNFVEPPAEGEIVFFGTRLSDGVGAPLEMRRRVTTVFQRPILLSRNVWANVAYGLQLRGKKEYHRQVDAALQRVGLSHLAKEKARTLSGGEAQRVALARAIVLQPDVLLLDEPTANLDPYNVGLIEDIVRTLNSERGTTIVLVTHNVFQARRLAHRVGLLLDGQIVEIAAAEPFFSAPRDPRTAAFAKGEMVY